MSKYYHLFEIYFGNRIFVFYMNIEIQNQILHNVIIFLRSPANVDAAKDWRDNYPEFKKKVSRCVRKSQEDLL